MPDPIPTDPRHKGGIPVDPPLEPELPETDPPEEYSEDSEED